MSSIKFDNKDHDNYSSIRDGYQQNGVIGFYEKHGSKYSNPHFRALTSCLKELLSKTFFVKVHQMSSPQQQQHEKDFTNDDCIIDNENNRLIKEFLEPFFCNIKLEKSNTQEKLRQAFSLTVLDLACGSGEGTRALIQALQSLILNIKANSANKQLQNKHHKNEKIIESSEQLFNHNINELRMPLFKLKICDPYTIQSFQQELERSPFPSFVQLDPTMYRFTFSDMASKEPLDGVQLDWCICSFALHLADTCLYGALLHLSYHCKLLIVLSPHKKPYIDEKTGWKLLKHIVKERVHGWIYSSLMLL